MNSWSAGGKGWIAEGSAFPAILGDDLNVNIGRPDEHYVTGAHFSFEPVSETWISEKKTSRTLGAGRRDNSTSKQGGSIINVGLGTAGQSYSGKYYNLDSESWSNITSSQSLNRPMGASAGGVGV